MKTRLFVAALLSALVSAFPAASQFYAQDNLVSNGFTTTTAPTDLNLVNAWGLVAGPTTPWWVADNGSAKSTLYNAMGVAIVPISPVDLLGHPPTGVVFNIAGSGFVLPGTSSSARFIFSTEDGTIIGWSLATGAVVAANRSASGAVYKGLAIATATIGTTTGTFLYATDFHNGVVDVYDSSFTLVSPPGGFVDRHLPERYAPFGIQAIGSAIYVTFAKQDKARHDDVAGKGRGFVDKFDAAGNMLQRVASHGTLNSPWGIALAPANFGTFSGDLLIGNFGDGRITAFAPSTKHPDKEFESAGQMRALDCSTLSIDGLWSLQFGKGNAASGPTNTLFFTAGPNSESDGLFGNLTAAAAPNCPPKHDDDDGSGGDDD
ncbi:MAG TPA: TIGR03118 family protein [Myxococcales bacterium]|nr:TIGR03118 family protein [Myxococcales bacterium]